MIILVAGGTGFIGQALTRHLLAAHHRVIVLSRNREKIQRIFSNTVQSLTWEELSIEHIKEVNAVINLSGANIAEQRWTPIRQHKIIASRIRPTQQLANLCGQLGGSAPVWVNASAIGVYDFISPAEFQKKIYDEDSPILFNETPSFLAKVARSWEMATWSARDKGVRVINARFGVVLDSRGGVLKKLLPSFKLGLGAKIGSGRQPFTWVSLHDVVRAIYFILNTPTIIGPVNIVSPQIVTQEEFADTLAEVLHRPRLITLPALAIKCLFGQMGVELLLAGVAVKPSRLLSQGFNFANSSLRQTLRGSNLEL